ncbi:methyltransferase domain-containing protein [Tengunoibacter tsumagoiensis]|uniref:Methyltransferase domain-containing protein n=1 Tax=Tengunoibacter tsumagoiensis TaxID=2014871 RepID=A0A402A2Z4_9CHLR|nr:methyltransferase domain-containing protein [Tengunoibacter tsumagoiensis]GCE13528.1 hypothetical protein KTT_33870 [Tengunoibacter tsumagoiensis]
MMKKPINDVTQFHSVDQAPDPEFYTQFMNASHAQPNAHHYKQEMIDFLALTAGATVLDVGCGTGQNTLDLAHAVGPQGHVVGIDNSETMLQAARARTAESQFSVEYRHADAAQMPFAAASFDACQASRVFGHLPDPIKVLAEMVRVTRPGGHIVVADGDLDLTVVDIPDRALARKMIHAACDQMVQVGIGRQLPRLFQQAGLSNIIISGRLMLLNYNFFRMAFEGNLQRAQAAGVISLEELSRFWEALEQAEQNQLFFAGVGGFIIKGQKAFD